MVEPDLCFAEEVVIHSGDCVLDSVGERDHRQSLLIILRGVGRDAPVERRISLLKDERYFQLTNFFSHQVTRTPRKFLVSWCLSGYNLLILQRIRRIRHRRFQHLEAHGKHSNQ